MNSIHILILVAILLAILFAWLMPRIFNNSSERLVRKIPELEKFAAKDRGKIWLEAICETLLQWQVIVSFLFVLGITAGLIISLNDFIPERLDTTVVYFTLFILFIAARPFIIRRARDVLVSKTNNIDNSK